MTESQVAHLEKTPPQLQNEHFRQADLTSRPISDNLLEHDGDHCAWECRFKVGGARAGVIVYDEVQGAGKPMETRGTFKHANAILNGVRGSSTWERRDFWRQEEKRFTELGKRFLSPGERYNNVPDTYWEDWRPPPPSRRLQRKDHEHFLLTVPWVMGTSMNSLPPPSRKREPAASSACGFRAGVTSPLLFPPQPQMSPLRKVSAEKVLSRFCTIWKKIVDWKNLFRSVPSMESYKPF